MTYSHATFEYSGISIDGFVTEDGTSYITLTSIGKGLGISRQNTKNWLEAHDQESEGISVNVGVRKSAAKAYPISTIVRFLDYRVGLGDKQASAFVLAGLGTDLDTANKEANLITVTPAQREVTRVGIRLDLVNAMYALDPTKKKDWVVYMELQGKSTEQERALLTSKRVYDQAIARMRNYDKRKTHTEYDTQINQWDISNLPKMREELAAQGVSC